MPDVRVCLTAELAADEIVSIRSLLDAAFAGDFTDDDWQHSIGGVHVLVERGDHVVAHASVVPRTLTIGDRDVKSGYVEAVAAAPSLQGTGLGTAVMAAIASVIAAEFEIGVLSTGEWHFYERLGWERWQGPTWIRQPDGTLERSEDDDDSVMILRTPSSPPIDLSAPITGDARAGDSW